MSRPWFSQWRFSYWRARSTWSRRLGFPWAHWYACPLLPTSAIPWWWPTGWEPIKNLKSNLKMLKCPVRSKLVLSCCIFLISWQHWRCSVDWRASSKKNMKRMFWWMKDSDTALATVDAEQSSRNFVYIKRKLAFGSAGAISTFKIFRFFKSVVSSSIIMTSLFLKHDSNSFIFEESPLSRCENVQLNQSVFVPLPEMLHCFSFFFRTYLLNNSPQRSFWRQSAAMFYMFLQPRADIFVVEDSKGYACLYEGSHHFLPYIRWSLKFSSGFRCIGSLYN